eukprot:SAG22_NODE_19_length_32182_cov_39.206963_9_plen_191_part_00
MRTRKKYDKTGVDAPKCSKARRRCRCPCRFRRKPGGNHMMSPESYGSTPGLVSALRMWVPLTWSSPVRTSICSSWTRRILKTFRFHQGLPAGGSVSGVSCYISLVWLFWRYNVVSEVSAESGAGGEAGGGDDSVPGEAEKGGGGKEGGALVNNIIQIVSTPPMDLVNIRCEVIPFHYTIIKLNVFFLTLF